MESSSVLDFINKSELTLSTKFRIKVFDHRLNSQYCFSTTFKTKIDKHITNVMVKSVYEVETKK